MRVRRRQWFLVAALAVIIVVGGLLVQPVTLLRVVTDDGATLVCRHVTDGATVTLAFIQPVYGGEVREIWQVDGSRLLRTGLETDTVAAAGYYADKGGATPVASGFSIEVPHLEVDAVPLRIQQDGQHLLRTGGDEISLPDRVEGTVRATMTVTRQPLIQQLFEGETGCG